MTETIIDEIMTLTEIGKQFDGEWILVGDPELGRSNEVIRGKVLCHSKDRAEVDAVAMRLHPKRSAFLYMGPIPDNIFINL